MTKDRPLFTVTASRRATGVLTPFLLLRSDWDDFGFKTTYVLFETAIDGGMIGKIKVLRRGQTPTRGGVLPDGMLPALGEEFCSLGQDLDFYERIASMPAERRSILLAGLRDAVFAPEHARSFSEEKGWASSVCRDIDDERDFVKLAGVLLTRDYTALPNLSTDISFQPAGWETPLIIHPGAGDDELFPVRMGIFAVRHRLPRRMTVLTGRNGSGKSTLLARLARVIHASQAERATDTLQRLGAIQPPGIGFTRIVTVSYSAFDAFELPGLDADERRQIAKDVKEGTGRYIYCGLRDVAREVTSEVDESERLDTDGPAGSIDERRSDNLLKPIGELGDEFVRLLTAIRAAGREPTLEQAISPLLDDPSFNDLEERTLAALVGDDPRGSFMAWSTGHKIALHLLTSLAAHVETRSMVLIDEPELHLHPPLLAALMHGVHYLLEERNAFAVCATHSPVVAQETLMRDMRIVRREGPVTTIRKPRIETFGESIGEITDEVFGLAAASTDYHGVLKQLLHLRGTVDAVDELFDRGLSLQARAYLMTLAAAPS